MSKNSGSRVAIVLLLAGSLGVGTLAYYVKSTPQAGHVPNDLRIEDRKESSRKPTPPQTDTKPDENSKPVETAPQDTVRLPVFGDDISDMALDGKATPVPGGGDPMKFVATRIAEAAHLDGARVLGVDVRDHVAFVSYNAAVQKGMGSMEEGAFLRALQVGFGQFANVDKVAVESDGKPLESGHVDLSEPLPVVRPGEKASDSSGQGEASGEP